LVVVCCWWRGEGLRDVEDVPLCPNILLCVNVIFDHRVLHFKPVFSYMADGEKGSRTGTRAGGRRAGRGGGGEDVDVAKIIAWQEEQKKKAARQEVDRVSLGHSYASGIISGFDKNDPAEQIESCFMNQLYPDDMRSRFHHHGTAGFDQEEAGAFSLPICGTNMRP